MLIKKEKPAKLLLILFEYFGFSILCGLASILFFSWTAKVIIANYELKFQADVTLQTEYWITLISLFTGIILAFFVLLLLFQRKFSYIVEMSRRVEEMEAGHLSTRLSIVGDDELADLAVRINALAETVESEIRISEEMREARLGEVAALSHDIRTPLTSVMSYLQFIREGKYNDGKQLRLYADRAYEKAYRIKEMTDSLFENCIRDIDDESPLEEVEGGGFLKQAFFELSDFLGDSGFTVDVELPLNESSFKIIISREKMARIFDNIVSNIEKYADSSNPIKLQAAISQGELVIKQSNVVVSEYQKVLAESHLLGLKGVEKMIKEIGGTVSFKEKNGIFCLVIVVPIK